MIGRLKGRVEEISAESLLLDVNGVGYLLSCSGRTLGALPGPGEAVAIWVETVMREDGIFLYGFIDKAEQGWFRLLTTVQGVGARMALAILTVLPPSQLSQAILMQDRAALTQANGVGPKLAARLLTELKDKAAKLDTGAALASAYGPGRKVTPGSMPAETAGQEDAIMAEAISALVNLGYNRQEAARGIATAYHTADEKRTLDILIREGLKELAR